MSTTVDEDILSAFRRWSIDERIPLGVMIDLALAQALRRRHRIDVLALVAGRRAGRPTSEKRFLELEALAAIRRRGGRPLRPSG